MRSSVVLPQPEGPSRVKNSPASMPRLTPSTAMKSPKRRVTLSNFEQRHEAEDVVAASSRRLYGNALHRLRQPPLTAVRRPHGSADTADSRRERREHDRGTPFAFVPAGSRVAGIYANVIGARDGTVSMHENVCQAGNAQAFAARPAAGAVGGAARGGEAARKPMEEAIKDIDRILWRAFRWLDEAMGHLEVIRPADRPRVPPGQRAVRSSGRRSTAASSRSAAARWSGSTCSSTSSSSTGWRATSRSCCASTPRRRTVSRSACARRRCRTSTRPSRTSGAWSATACSTCSRTSRRPCASSPTTRARSSRSRCATSTASSRCRSSSARTSSPRPRSRTS